MSFCSQMSKILQGLIFSILSNRFPSLRNTFQQEHLLRQNCHQKEVFVFPYILSLSRLTGRPSSELPSHILASRGLRHMEGFRKYQMERTKSLQQVGLEPRRPSPKQVRCQDFKGHVKISQKQIPLEASSGVSRFFKESTGNALFQHVYLRLIHVEREGEIQIWLQNTACV